MYSEGKFSIVDIIKTLGIPREQLQDWTSRCFFYACDQESILKLSVDTEVFF